MGEWAVAWRQQGEGADQSISSEASSRALERQCAAAEAVFKGLGLGRKFEREVAGVDLVKTARKNHRGRDGGRGASAEWSQTDCQPCVSLV